MSVVLEGVQALRDAPAHITSVLVRTTAQAKAPQGWREVGRGVHLGSGLWLLRFERGGDDA